MCHVSPVIHFTHKLLSSRFHAWIFSCACTCIPSLHLTDDARDQSEPVRCQPQPQVHGLMVDLKRAVLTLVECIRWPQAIITVNKSLHNHPSVTQVQSKRWLTQWSAMCSNIILCFCTNGLNNNSTSALMVKWHFFLPLDTSYKGSLHVSVIADMSSFCCFEKTVAPLLDYCYQSSTYCTGQQSYVFTFIV